ADTILGIDAGCSKRLVDAGAISREPGFDGGGIGSALRSYLAAFGRHGFGFTDSYRLFSSYLAGRQRLLLRRRLPLARSRRHHPPTNSRKEKPGRFLPGVFWRR